MHERGGSTPSVRPRSTEKPDVSDIQNVCYQRRGTGPGDGLASECFANKEITQYILIYFL